MQNTLNPIAATALALGIVLAFVGIWCFVVLLLSRLSGWHRLGRAFRAQTSCTGARMTALSGSIGGVSYRNCLTVHVTRAGFFMSPLVFFRLGHPVLFIPWSAVSAQEHIQFLWNKAVRFRVGEPPVASITLPARVFEEARRVGA